LRCGRRWVWTWPGINMAGFGVWTWQASVSSWVAVVRYGWVVVQCQRGRGLTWQALSMGIEVEADMVPSSSGASRSAPQPFAGTPMSLPPRRSLSLPKMTRQARLAHRGALIPERGEGQLCCCETGDRQRWWKDERARDQIHCRRDPMFSHHQS